MTVGPAFTNLHVRDVSLASMQRLLGRRTADGTLMPVDPDLIKAAIAAGRAQAADIRTLLKDMPHDPADQCRGPVDKLMAAVGELEVLLDDLGKMLIVMDD